MMVMLNSYARRRQRSARWDEGEVAMVGEGYNFVSVEDGTIFHERFDDAEELFLEGRIVSLGRGKFATEEGNWTKIGRHC